MGLWSSFIPLVVYGLMASSTQLQPGPVAPIALLIESALASQDALGADVPMEDTAKAVVALTFVAGIIQLLLALLRFGWVASLLSAPVMAGFTSAAGVIIVVSQLKDLLGLSVQRADNTVLQFVDTMAAFDTIQWQATLVGLLCLIILLGSKYAHWKGKKIPRAVPIPAILVVVVILLSALLDWQHAGVPVIGDVPKGLPPVTLPPITGFDQLVKWLPSGFVIAVVGYVGSISLAVVFGKERGEEVSANQELLALGTSCVAGSCFSAFPVSGSFTRTAVNADLGARTSMAVLWCAGVVLAALLLLAPLFSPLPKATLAAMVIASCKSLFKVHEFGVFWRSSRGDAWMMLAAFILVIVANLDIGLGLAVALNLAVLLWRSFKPRLAELGRFPGTDVFMDMVRFPDAKRVPGVRILRVDGELHFGNIKSITTQIQDLARRSAEVKSYVMVPPNAGHVAAQHWATSRTHSRENSIRLRHADNESIEGGQRDSESPHSMSSVHGAREPSNIRRREGERVQDEPEHSPTTGAAAAAAAAAADDAASRASKDAPLTSREDEAVHIELAQLRLPANLPGSAESQQALVDARQSPCMVLSEVDQGLHAACEHIPGMTLGEAAALYELHTLVLDGVRVVCVDASAAAELIDTVTTIQKSRTPLRIVLAAFPGPVRDKMRTMGIHDVVGPENVHLTVSAAVSSVYGKTPYTYWTETVRGYGALLDSILGSSVDMRAALHELREGNPGIHGSPPQDQASHIVAVQRGTSADNEDDAGAAHPRPGRAESGSTGTKPPSHSMSTATQELADLLA